MIVGAGHRRGFHVHFPEVAQALQTHLGEVDLRRGCPSALHLAHFPAHHFILGDPVAGEADAAHVGALARIDHEVHIDVAGLLVHQGHPGGGCEGVAGIAERPLQAVLGGGQQLLGEHLAGGDQEQAPQILRLHVVELAEQVDLIDHVLAAFLHVHGDIDLALVRGDAHLGRVDVELDEAPVLVVGLQLFQVAGELLPAVLVVVAEE